jgi:hypothetical protein
MIGINLEKAKDIWRDKIRTARNEKFKELDIEFMRAVETADTDTQTSVAAQKQALRDAPADSAITDATTPNELKNIQPAGLEIE